jgi:hypothetical protein
MKSTLRALAVTALVFGLAPRASASTIWTLNDVNLFCANCAVGGLTNTVVGSFTVDPTLTSVLSYDITVSGAFSGVDYHYDSALNPGNSSVFQFTSTLLTLNDSASPFDPYLTFAFAPLSNTPNTTVSLLSAGVSYGSSTYTCGPPNSDCGQLDTAGSISNSASSVPEPATLSLLGAGLLSLGLRRKQRAKR